MAQSSLLEDRELLRQFAVFVFGEKAKLQPLLGDASLRVYYRVVCGDKKAILMDSRLQIEAWRKFLYWSAILRTHFDFSPKIYAEDERGLLLLEDLGHVALFDVLEEVGLDAPFLLLSQLQTLPLKKDMPIYGQDLFMEELSRPLRWFFPMILGRALRDEEKTMFWQDALCLWRYFQALPQGFVHRDFHSRNLLWHEGRLRVIDFQDACLGALAYDVVSLTRDCYVLRKPEAYRALEALYQRRFMGAVEQKLWANACEALALQRHLKVLGIFMRLAFEEKRRAYLPYLPNVWRYVMEEACALKEELPFMYDFLSACAPLFADFVKEGKCVP